MQRTNSDAKIDRIDSLTVEQSATDTLQALGHFRGGSSMKLAKLITLVFAQAGDEAARSDVREFLRQLADDPDSRLVWAETDGQYDGKGVAQPYRVQLRRESG